MLVIVYHSLEVNKTQKNTTEKYGQAKVDFFSMAHQSLKKEATDGAVSYTVFVN